MPEKPHINIWGATSMIAPLLVQRLLASGYTCRCFSRKRPAYLEKFKIHWRPFSLHNKKWNDLEPNSIIVSLLPLWTFGDMLPWLTTCHQVIAFSTTSIFGKEQSPNPEERQIVWKIKKSEEKISEYCQRRGIAWTIFRPTLIYDGKTDRNITRMAEFIKRWGILPVAAPATGLRQPVHADDLAAAVVQAIDNPAAKNQTYNLGGGEILNYTEMCQRIFLALGRKSRIIPIPLGTIRLVCRAVNRLTGGKGPNEAMFIRMNQNLTYDQRGAQQDLGYTPRPFHPEF